ncbi:hypothetical protein MG290_07670 [Flavobacterium sp. CBA20B-1]|uniref:hypothetical protein n=1 Tax=unclassified Flavobacterium TaxID=196869 RepID=UPI002225AAEC|nr:MULTISPECIES: hypothetical protein [unclassified Flavobacterium]WCM40856.1 hypothetical protein MG290_07670 [Flavobacterium sp. CBA20B-1]
MTQKLINRFENSKYNNSDLFKISLLTLNNPSEKNIESLTEKVLECVEKEEEICKSSKEFFGENDDYEYDSNLVSIVKHLEKELKTNLSKELSDFNL